MPLVDEGAAEDVPVRRRIGVTRRKSLSGIRMQVKKKEGE